MPKELDRMEIGDIAILEHGLEAQQQEMDRLEREGPSGAASAPGQDPPGVDVQPPKPRSAAEERQMAIQQYEAQQRQQFGGMTNDERLAALGITMTSAADEQ